MSRCGILAGTIRRSGQPIAQDSYTFLCEVARPTDVEQLRNLLDDAGVPYRSGLLVAEPPRLVFSVPVSRLIEAQSLLRASDSRLCNQGDAQGDPSDEPFPWQALQILVGVVLVHFMIVILTNGSVRSEVLQWGALVKGGTAVQPWRLLTSLMLHSGLRHAFWNGVSMIVFGVPLLARLGLQRTTLVYFSAGIGGSVTALWFAEAGTRIIGSSGAVAGLFGAWVILTLARTRYAELVLRERIRTIGISLLFLPSLLSPVSSSGNPVSVSSHLGGLATGMLIGMLISQGLLSRLRGALRQPTV